MFNTPKCELISNNTIIIKKTVSKISCTNFMLAISLESANLKLFLKRDIPQIGRLKYSKLLMLITNIL